MDAPAPAVPYAHPRQPYFIPGSPAYAYYEGSPVDNKCTRDESCLVSGCSRSTCAAEKMTITDEEFCEERMFTQAVEPHLAQCGCLHGECRWYFEDDYDRTCEVDSDCAGLGDPPAGAHSKGRWVCDDGSCNFR
jgi:eight-cysteine-cluster-containing protein